jgi:phospholipid/cholesterol/gamma-HCH transport system substrate-binding protein
MSNTRLVLLGLLFLGALGVLGYYTLFLTDFSLFRERFELVVQFSEANGLRRGDSVQVAGVRKGRVETVTFDADAALERRVTVTLSLDDPIELREDYEIAIEDATVLGGHTLRIEPGAPGAAVVPVGTQLFGTVEPNALAALRGLVEDNRENLSGTIEDLRAVIAMAREGRGPIGRLLGDEALGDELATLVESSSQSARNLATITDVIARGDGLLGRLLNDDALYADVQTTLTKLGTALDEAAAVARAAREGEGLVGRFVSDPALADDVAGALADLREVVARVARAEGTLGKLISDDAIAANVEEITAALVSGRGTLGMLLTRPDLYENLDDLSRNLVVVSNALRDGEGTLGRIVMDDDLYLQLKQAMGIVTRTLEEFREAAPVTTFTSVLFGAF